MPTKGHAILSASSSERWIHCPPSARLCESYSDKGSDYAAEGTDAHTLCDTSSVGRWAWRQRTQPKTSTGSTRRWPTVPLAMLPTFLNLWK